TSINNDGRLQPRQLNKSKYRYLVMALVLILFFSFKVLFKENNLQSDEGFKYENDESFNYENIGKKFNSGSENLSSLNITEKGVMSEYRVIIRNLGLIMSMSDTV
ncbi:10991_t:CDS:2, partial [Dentiscutata heterogama]